MNDRYLCQSGLTSVVRILSFFQMRKFPIPPNNHFHWQMNVAICSVPNADVDLIVFQCISHISYQNDAEERCQEHLSMESVRRTRLGASHFSQLFDNSHMLATDIELAHICPQRQPFIRCYHYRYQLKISFVVLPTSR